MGLIDCFEVDDYTKTAMVFLGMAFTLIGLGYLVTDIFFRVMSFLIIPTLILLALMQIVLSIKQMINNEKTTQSQKKQL